MKKIAGLLLCSSVLFNCLTARAQSPAESALLFSRTSPGGSARVQAMGGAQVSLGGDYSSAYSNPAGLGMYNRSEVTLSPGFTSSNTSSALAAPYAGAALSGSQSNLNLQGFSLAIHKNKNNGKFLSGTFGITYNRTNNFNRTFNYSGTNPNNSNNSIIDYFIADANNHSNGYGGLGQGDLFYTQSNGFINSAGLLFESPTRLAYDNFIINPNAPPDTTHYGSDVPATSNSPRINEQVKTSGGQSQVNLSYGVNIDDKFFVGGGIGLASINYQSSRTYTETFPGLPLNSLVLSENFSTQNSNFFGINATLGTIYRPFDFVQLGASVATPTYYSLEDSYNSKISSNWNSSSYHSLYGANTSLPVPSSIDQVPVDYTLTTPWRLNGGATFFIQKHGFITADIEYLNYGSSHYSSVSVSSDDIPNSRYYSILGDNYVQGANGANSVIKSLYRPVLNYRFGGEYRISNFRIRAGYNFMPDPYKNIQNGVDNKITSISAGVGYRTAKFFVDLAAIQKQGSTFYRPYSAYGGLYPESGPLVTTKNTYMTFMVTVGYILPNRESKEPREPRAPRFRQF